MDQSCRTKPATLPSPEPRPLACIKKNSVSVVVMERGVYELHNVLIYVFSQRARNLLRYVYRMVTRHVADSQVCLEGQ